MSPLESSPTSFHRRPQFSRFKRRETVNKCLYNTPIDSYLLKKHGGVERYGTSGWWALANAKHDARATSACHARLAWGTRKTNTRRVSLAWYTRYQIQRSCFALSSCICPLTSPFNSKLTPLSRKLPHPGLWKRRFLLLSLYVEDLIVWRYWCKCLESTHAQQSTPSAVGSLGIYPPIVRQSNSDENNQIWHTPTTEKETKISY